MDLSVCSPISRDPISLPSQVPTSSLPSIPSHQKIHTHTHTHTNIIFSPFDVYFNCSHQFTKLVWESVFSWLVIFKKADLWRHNSKLSDLYYSVTGCPGCTSPGSLILGWLTYLLFWFCLLLWFCLLFWYLFLLWFSFLRAQEQKKQFGFLVFFTFFDWVAYDQIFFLMVPCRGLLTLIIIFRAWKDKRRVLVLRKENKNWVGRDISWKRDVGWWGLLCQARAV